MTPLAIIGTGAVHPDGVGAALLPTTADPAGELPGASVASFAGEPLPPAAHRFAADFDVRELLGRKGTSFYDRATAMAVVACGEALRSAGIVGGPDGDARTGVVLGTTLGSFRSTSDYSRETLVQEKPYLVNPVLFPNTVMNCAAGQVAIRYRLRGVNSTVATGPLAMVSALRYAHTTIVRGAADVLLAGAVEEFSAHRAWWVHRRHGGPTGEGAAVFAVRADAPGLDRDAEILGLATGFAPDPADALAACVRRVLAQAARSPAEVTAVILGDCDATAEATAAVLLGHHPARIWAGHWWGECDAAAGALGLAVFLAQVRAGILPDGALGLLTATSPDGAAGATLVRGWARAADRA
ncbi:beta-ketoacyl synthase N-terminal-like domain-containing protein [Micromonospora sp. FIMYZ51]|uniref:beta-ketoacyl synthase N-terminal-like domain-containing protein n=1 Tax=Micromonospora sp. FIMYZ51 TaxID=3051832 RepID=UPI00312017D1